MTAFHVHTNLTDGKSSVSEYVKACLHLGVRRLVFLEHIHRIPRYDVGFFLDEVERARGSSKGRLLIQTGFETKMQEDGTLDLPPSLLHDPRVDWIGVAEHSVECDLLVMSMALNTFFRSLPATRARIVWVHPGLSMLMRQKVRPSLSYYRHVLDGADERLIIEYNAKYLLPELDLLRKLSRRFRCVVGLDAHSVEDLERLIGFETGRRQADLPRPVL